MSWGALISGVGSIVGGLAGMSSAQAQQEMAWREYYANEDQRRKDNAYRDAMFMQGIQSSQREAELVDYYNQINEQNRALVAEQMQYSRDWVQQQRDYLLQDQEYERYRISEADRMAADERTRELEKLANDEQTSKEERQRALEELAYTRSIAAGEREYDVKRYEQDQLMSQYEYQLRLREYERMLGQANEERDYIIQRQEAILSDADLLDDEITRFLTEDFGDIVPIKRYSEEDVARKEADFYNAYLSDADRAADRLASVNEAGLIKNGIDFSTTGDNSRRLLLQEQLVPLYDKARMQARNEALGYITGLQKNEIDAALAQMDQRDKGIAELLQGFRNKSSVLGQMRDPSSAILNDYLQLGSGILNRDLGSANEFAAPINIGSGILNRDINSGGMIDRYALQTNPASIGPNSDAGLFSPQSANVTSAGGLLQTAANMRTSASNFFEFFANGAKDASGSGWESIIGGLESLGKMAGPSSTQGTAPTTNAATPNSTISNSFSLFSNSGTSNWADPFADLRF